VEHTTVELHTAQPAGHGVQTLLLFVLKNPELQVEHDAVKKCDILHEAQLRIVLLHD